MIVHDVEQGTEEWLRLRAGIPTSSEFSRIITPKTRKPSKSQDAYMHLLISERLLERPGESFLSAWMERGQELEHQAAAFYGFKRGLDLEQVGFITTDDGRAGTSPDRLAGPKGLCEIKCPSPHVHVGYLLTERISQDYWPQLQGQLWITGREWVDIISYHPDMAEKILRVERDEEYIELLAAEVTAFCDRLEETFTNLASEIGWAPTGEPGVCIG